MSRKSILSLVTVVLLFAASNVARAATMRAKGASPSPFVYVRPRHLPKIGTGTLQISHLDGRTGNPITRFETIHEKPQHVIAIGNQQNGDFSFAHRHPRLKGDRSAVRVPFTHDGWYAIFVEAQPVGSPLAINRTFVSVGSPVVASPKLTPDMGLFKRFGNLQARLTASHGGPVLSDQPTELVFDVRGAASSKPVRGFRPYLGADGHAIAYQPIRKEIQHLHAGGGHGSMHGGAAVAGNTSGQLRFPVTFVGSGTYPVWVQAKIGASVRLFRFNVQVVARQPMGITPPATAASAPPSHSGHSAPRPARPTRPVASPPPAAPAPSPVTPAPPVTVTPPTHHGH